jgi:hypothetical protein
MVNLQSISPHGMCALEQYDLFHWEDMPFAARRRHRSPYWKCLYYLKTTSQGNVQNNTLWCKKNKYVLIVFTPSPNIIVCLLVWENLLEVAKPRFE